MALREGVSATAEGFSVAPKAVARRPKSTRGLLEKFRTTSKRLPMFPQVFRGNSVAVQRKHRGGYRIVNPVANPNLLVLHFCGRTAKLGR